MGEFADMLIDQYYDDPKGYWSNEDNWDCGYSSSYKSYKTIKCKYCNSKDVYWAQHSSGKWHLKDNKTKQWHTCKPKEEANKKFQDNNKLVEIIITKKVPNNNCSKCIYYSLEDTDWGPQFYICALFNENIFNNKRLDKCIKSTKSLNLMGVKEQYIHQIKN